MTKADDPRLERYMAPFRLLQQWNAIENGGALFSELLTTASIARDAHEDVPQAVLSNPRLLEVFKERPSLARTVEDHLPALNDLLDAFDLYKDRIAARGGIDRPAGEDDLDD